MCQFLGHPVTVSRMLTKQKNAKKIGRIMTEDVHCCAWVVFSSTWNSSDSQPREYDTSWTQTLTDSRRWSSSANQHEKKRITWD